MSKAAFTGRLVWLHRWLALALTPIFLLVIATGGILAFVPITEDLSQPVARASVDSVALLRTIDTVDPDGTATMVTVAPDGRTVTLTLAGTPKTFTVADATPVAETAPAAPASDFFHTVENLHKNLAIGAGFLVQIAAYAMVLIVVIGPLLAWPRLANTLSGWHRAMGWFLLPLVLMLPLTGVLMSLGVGGAELPPLNGGRTTPVAALHTAASEIDLGNLVSARSFKGGRVLITMASEPGIYVASAASVTPMTEGPGLVKSLHEGTWGGMWSGLLNFVGSVALIALTVTGLLSWWRRRRLNAATAIDTGAEILVAHASHTGTAARLAEATATRLRAAGHPVALAALGAVEPADLARYREVLIIASTTGEGELPDSGLRFLKRLDGTRLDSVAYDLLGLGDRRYATFCGGAETLDARLRAAGARPRHPMQRADGEPGPAWRDWLGGIHPALDLKEAPETADTPVTLMLATRALMTDPSVSESYHLEFTSDTPVDYRPGDLLVFTPQGHAPRYYSISSAEAKRITLTVGLARFTDSEGQAHTGVASGLLCLDLPVGTTIRAAVRRHDAFRAPAAARPLVMIAAGCGIAPFVGYLAERRRRAASAPAWMFFGCRRRQGDFLYRDQLEADLAAGTLARLSTAFSRDADPAYVQDRMRAEGEELYRWLTTEDAAIRVCGRATTLGHGVEQALIDILHRFEGLDDEAARRRLDDWRQSGKLAFDLFD
ncbi:MAG: PepSY domain-containing protein [Zavarzinia sp.]|nr:PepSY domain-containing protein [Zavarzinia sp.]